MRFPSAFLAGAATAFFFDPRLGRRRRNLLRDRALAAKRRLRRLVTRKTRYVAGHARGVAAELQSSAPKPYTPGDDDATVKQRILSNAFRDLPVTTSDLQVEVEGGVATLRGSVESSSLADDLIARVREVPGVRAVTPQLTVVAPGTELDHGI